MIEILSIIALLLASTFFMFAVADFARLVWNDRRNPYDKAKRDLEIRQLVERRLKELRQR